jgi:hypothetical protein
MKKEYKDLSKAYQSIYEVVTDRPTNPTTLKPDPRSTKIAQDLFAKPSTIAPAATPTKPASTPPTVATTVSPPPTPAVPQKTFQQELDDLRKASAQATMAGPSKEAQALMSTRAKNILGPEKLRAGIEGQERVEKMKSEIGMPKVEAPKPAAVPPPAPTLPPPSTKPETRQPTSPPPPKPSTGLTPEEKKQIDDFRKLSTLEKLSRKNEMEKRLSKLDPKKKQEVMDYYNRKESYEDLYDEVLDYLINEGYSEEESKKIMVKDISTLVKNINN